MSAVGETSPGRMPWWLWLTVICALAPLSAWAWQALFAEVTNVRLPPAAHAALPLTLWIVAVADRVLEASRRETWRHRALRKHRIWFLAALGIAVATLVRLVFWELSTTIMELGIFLGVIVIFYLFLARMEIGPKAALPLEIVRGGVFSAGVLLPTFGMASVPPAALQLMISQTLLVSLMLLANTCHEHKDLPKEAAHRRDWESIDMRLGVWLVLLLGTILWLARVETQQPGSNMVRYYMVMGMVVVAAFVLYLLRKRFSSDTLHLLSWLALCTPAIAMLF